VLQAEEAASFLEYLEKNPELTAKSAYRIGKVDVRKG
jgi:hypothetical protein